MALRPKNGAVLLKLESTPGTIVTPSASTDGIRVEGYPRISAPIGLVNTNEVSASFDDTAPIPIGAPMRISFDCFVKGSGTAGGAPEFGDALKACGMSETLTATAIPVAAEVGSAGTVKQLTLGASAAATLSLYRGMPILLTVNPVAGGRSFIHDYSAAKVAKLCDTFGSVLSNTTNYQIPVNALYAPASTSLAAATIYCYRDGKLWKMTGARGTFRLAMTAGGPAKLTFDFTGISAGQSDAAVPAVTYDQTRPPVWSNNDGVSGAMTIDSVAAAVGSLNLEFGARHVNPPNPNSVDGFDVPEQTGRAIMVTVDPLETLIATRDLFAGLQASTTYPIHARAGATAGNRYGLVVPAGQPVDWSPGERDNLAVENVRFAAPAADAGAFLTFY